MKLWIDDIRPIPEGYDIQAFTADAAIEYKMTVTTNYAITIPTWGAHSMKFRHSSIGTITSSSALITVSRNYNLMAPFMELPN